MPTAPVTSLPATPPSTETPYGNSKLGKQAFLKLLTTQLANQDPLQPVDNQAFIAQLAQFAAVEQQSQMNSTLESLLVAQASANQTAVANLVGKDLTFITDKVHLDPTGDVTINGQLSEKAHKLSAIIKDSNGKVVRSIVIDADRNAGPLALTWDGRDSNGQRVTSGDYTVTLTAEDEKGKSVPITTQGRGRVSGVSFADGIPQLIVNGVRVRLSDVQEVNEPNSSNVQPIDTSSSQSPSTTPAPSFTP